MIKNYLKIAWRNIARNRVYTAINILGLAMGICACISIYVVTSYELSFDTFHPDKQRIYRIMDDATESTGDVQHFARLPMGLAPAIRQSVPGVEAIAGINFYNVKSAVRGDQGKLVSFTDNSGIVITDPQLFDIFKYNWLAGNSASLSRPFTVVLTEKKAHQYFGNIPMDEIVGKEIVYDDSLVVKVSGIVQDWTQKSDFAYTDFISSGTLQSSFLKKSFNLDSWSEGDMSTWAFVKLHDGVQPAQINQQIAAIIKQHTDPKTKLSPWLEPLSDIHFNANVIENPLRTAHLPTLYLLMGIALFILILAVINFINLSTAQSIRRAKEVGVRKVLGSNRYNLILQFLTETFVLTFFAVLLAVVMVQPVLTAFRSFIPDGVSFRPANPSTIIFLVVLTIITSLLAGLYPAKVLSSYLPVISLKGSGAYKGSDKWMLRKALIVFQFTVSLIFIIGTIVIARQFNYIRAKDLGFSTDAIITVEAPRGDSLSKARFAAEKIKQLSGVNHVALAWATPGNAKGMRIKFRPSDTRDIGVGQVDGNEGLIPLYHIKLLAGRNLSHSDSVNEFVINEKMSRLMGCKTPSDAIGKTIYWFNKPYPVVGVVANFHSSSLHAPIIPVCIINRVEREGTLVIKLAAKGKRADGIKPVLAKIEKVWKSIYPSGVFDYKFYDDTLARAYQQDEQAATLMNVAMGVTIFISCIGLFGLVLFMTEKKSKEISIRKILGASATNIAAMLSKDFIQLVIIALLIASPVAWFVMNSWLQGFAYHTSISLWVFMLAGLSAIIIALITVGFQAIKAALTNPVRSLRSE
jgi:ABC-type antimicrobial peptide transport system permease subunit